MFLGGCSCKAKMVVVCNKHLSEAQLRTLDDMLSGAQTISPLDEALRNASAKARIPKKVKLTFWG